jgi:NAD(P)-dependent dehydrogenase (short-subunit alcohol dehydrogenase family)
VVELVDLSSLLLTQVKPTLLGFLLPPSSPFFPLPPPSPLHFLLPSSYIVHSYLTTASKAGVIGLTMSVARSVAPFNIRVNAIAPGPIRTELQSFFPEEKMKILRENFPLGWGSQTDVAESVLYLASDASKWMTGSVLDINGGHLMG